MEKRENGFISITMYKTQVQMHQRPQHKAYHTEHHRREIGKYLEHFGTGDHCQIITTVAKTLRATINKCDL